jgi:hypothetical protein
MPKSFSPARVTRRVVPLVLAVTACTTLVYHALYDVDLTTARRQLRGEPAQRLDANGHRFDDGSIRIIWTPTELQLGMVLVNKTNSPLRVLWDEVRFIGPDGKVDRVVHEAGTAQGATPLPAFVAAGATLLDFIEPASHVRSLITHGDAPLIGSTSGSSEAEVRSKMIRGTMEVVLPIEINGAVREYIFTMKIRGSVALSGWAS